MGSLSTQGVALFDVAAPDTTAPTVTLTEPADGAVTADPTPALSGVGGTAAGDAASVTVRIWAGSVGGGTPDYTLGAAVDPASGAYSSSGPYTRVSDFSSVAALPDGTYTARAFQSDSATNEGQSSATPTFTIDTAAPDTDIRARRRAASPSTPPRPRRPTTCRRASRTATRS